MKHYNEMIENYCQENGIDPLRLFENGRENRRQYRENPGKFIRTNIKENENDPKTPKLDDSKLSISSGASENAECLKSIESYESIPIASMDDENTESSGLLKSDEPNSCQKVQREPDWKFENVFRTERPLNRMGTYTKLEVWGIIPDNVLKVFTRERNMRFKQLAKVKRIEERILNSGGRLNFEIQMLPEPDNQFPFGLVYT